MKTGKFVGRVLCLDYHRNGISGEGFHAITFEAGAESDNPGERMIASVFPGEGCVSVFSVSKLAGEAANSCAFGLNSWRGDRFEPELRAAIAKAEGREP